MGRLDTHKVEDFVKKENALADRSLTALTGWQDTKLTSKL